ncbi:sensor domain-containing diguanylate cyclase [Qipengyuania qiaonensis]|uniref:diguanylate cyclase n=1 Tax=Qipengyuania qiaonensis TaxID=2867240 RepID=A0ABS7J2T9_9SPHN|nr:sensor domain-containing diguanylate cyclase [Qipengyuania qiaonensis]MBX7481577.1 sensor domain-containing diguanylate cyclase [Qipengyuania qiaonensis]
MTEILLRDEASRLAALAEYEIMDTASEKPFERIVQLVRTLLGVPMATVTFIDKDRQWFKARRGVEHSETERKVAVCDHTIRSIQPLVVPDLRADPRFRELPAVTDSPPIQSYLGIPLVTEEGFALGALCAMDHQPREFDPEQIALLREFAGLVIDWLEMRRIAQTDFLTGAMARRSFLKELNKEIARHVRHRRPVALAVFDVDHFKSVNDAYGHGVGDEVLKAVVSTCEKSLRSGDIVARLGGEEFALLLPESDASEAFAAAERFRTEIEAIRLPGLPDFRITASFGVATFIDDYGYPDQWIAAADGELYRAKHSGRNRTCMIGQAEDGG